MREAPILLLLLLLAASGLSAQAPALNAPSPLPLDPAGYGPSGLSIAILLQVRGDFPEAGDRSSTFLLRKAELGIKAHISEGTDLSLELDPVRPSDPLRRTYIRLSHLRRLHVKLGMEKAPLGLEELLSTVTLPFVDRSEVSDRFAAAEEVGVHLESRWDHWLFQFSVTNGGRRLLRDDNDYKDLSGRVVWAPAEWGSLGVAALRGRAGESALPRDRYNFEAAFGSRDSGVQAEFYRARDADVWSSAYYVTLFRTLDFEGVDAFDLQALARYEWIERSDDTEAEEVSVLTLGAAFLLDGHRSKLQVNYLIDPRPEFGEREFRVQYQVAF